MRFTETGLPVAGIPMNSPWCVPPLAHVQLPCRRSQSRPERPSAYPGKRCEHYLEVLEHAVLRRWESRYFAVLDEVIGELPAETVNVTGVDKVVKTSY